MNWSRIIPTVTLPPRQTGEYFFWQTDNSVGFRWTERVATYTGFELTGTTYADVDKQ